MSATWKTVRVFIGSTFRDMQAERDYLVTVVFPDPSTSLRAGLRPPSPRLRRAGERVEQLGLEFYDVHLRRTVSDYWRNTCPISTEYALAAGAAEHPVVRPDDGSFRAAS